MNPEWKTFWCPSCATWFDMHPDRFRWLCPSCKSAIMVCKCIRCGHEWRPRYPEPPLHCASCGSVYWNKRRTRNMRVPNRKRKVI